MDMAQAEIERNYYRTLYENLALSASIFSTATTNIKLCVEVQKDADSSLDEIAVARLLEERSLNLQEKAQTLMLDIMEFKLKNSEIVLSSRNNIGIKFSKRLDAIIDEMEQYASSVDGLEKMIKERTR